MSVVRKISMMVGFSTILIGCQLEEGLNTDQERHGTDRDSDFNREEVSQDQKDDSRNESDIVFDSEDQTSNHQRNREVDVDPDNEDQSEDEEKEGAGHEDESESRRVEVMPDQTFELGSDQDDIRIVQEQLIEVGYQLEVDSVFGIDTQRAIYHFQKEHEHLSNDGIYGSETRAALEEALENKVEIDTNGFAEIQLPHEQKREEDHSEAEIDSVYSENVAEEALFEGMVFVGSMLNVRETPDAGAEKVGRLKNGAHVFALKENGNWTFVYSNDATGWVANPYIKEIPYDSTQKQTVSNPNDLLVLVNKKYQLPNDYEPEDLVIPDVPFPFKGTPERKYLREEAAKALEELFEASQEAGVELYATSGYRSFATQKEIFSRNVSRLGFEIASQTSAFPSESEHQTGLAMDVTSSEVNFSLTTSFGDTKEGKWVEENAHKFGYIIRYQPGKEDITGYTYEPWHLRYIGKKAAKEIDERGITLEEYLN
ncbi:D-alanyl-D-alanine carboxypeptidase family protein [Halalkalibacterium halodurans]|uniref:D-alanyl-D-alanine carboxypeptidase family protein n=1 Tax=Halalkalibacterium halodurans TaxID=86665 RepID=UPI002E2413B3|nr:D-alanyl-D-alanine carboxypeptidase family protein [Halalkalibacterium halodurans]MED4163150.1 D-alanyl-D-alanine carboxypeptidase family protein [Halalkalibacterium halodurans]